MAALSSVAAPALLAGIVALIGFFLWRRGRARRALADDPESISGASRQAVPSEPPDEYLVTFASDEELVEVEREPVTTSAVLSIHDKPTREFSAHVPSLAEGAAHRMPTRELPVFREEEQEYTVNYAPGFEPNRESDLGRADDGELTSLYQPDAHTLDALRELASQPLTKTARPRPLEPSPRASQPPSGGLPRLSPFVSERARAHVSEHAGLKKGREPSGVRRREPSLERPLMERVLTPSSRVDNQVRTSGFIAAKSGDQKLDGGPNSWTADEKRKNRA
jgi:hypothetical protein